MKIHVSRNAKILIAGIIIWAVAITGYILAYRTNQDQYPDEYPWTCPEEFSPGECATIEDHAKVDVSQREETRALVSEYGSDKVTVRALDYSYVDNPEYMQSLFGDRFEEVHCIVFVDWPDGQKVYVETSFHEYEIFTPGEFEQLLSGASEDDIDTLYSNLH